MTPQEAPRRRATPSRRGADHPRVVTGWRTGRPRTAERRRQEASAARSTAITSGVRSRMQAQRTRDTGPEIAVRRLLHAAGLRYRVDRPPLPGLRRRLARYAPELL